MTVCIAAICRYSNGDPLIVGASDRMLSAPDIKFEPPQQRIYALHQNAVALVAGDPYAQISICDETLRAHQAKPRQTIKELAELYADAFSAQRRKVAEAKYLKPLDLDVNSLIDRSPDFHTENVARLQIDMALRPWCPPPPAPKHRPIQPGEIVADERMRAYALSTLRNETKRLAEMSRDSGRNIRLHGAGCVLGKYVVHKVLALAEVEAAMLAACRANGLAKDDGEQQCLKTLGNGIKKASGDGLPALQYWGRSTR